MIEKTHWYQVFLGAMELDLLKTKINSFLTMSANKEAYEKFTKEELSMYESLKELMKDEFEKNENRILERVASDILKGSYPIFAIIKISKLSEDVIRSLAKSMVIAVV